MQSKKQTQSFTIIERNRMSCLNKSPKYSKIHWIY